MKDNCIVLNGQKNELTESQVDEIKNSFKINTLQLKDIPVGETFKVGNLEFVVLEHESGTSAVILKEFWKASAFDDSSNDYKESEIRKQLNTDFYNELSSAVGEENIIEHVVDLTSDDGRKDYEYCTDKVSLLTCDKYRKYVLILDKYRPGSWWWLATAYSTKDNGYSLSVRCVGNFGALYYMNCSNDYGVRPFCIFKSNIFVSKQRRKTMNSVNIKIGKTVNVAGEEFIILDKFENSVLCLAKDFAYHSTRFDGNTNNYAESKIRKKLNSEYLSKIAEVIGEENIIASEIDLTSDDGLDDYGKVTDKIGLLTADMYRKYSRIIEKYPVDDWWWLATPWSTAHRGYLFSVRCVCDDGALDNLSCNYGNGVRPFLIFSTSIF